MGAGVGGGGLVIAELAREPGMVSMVGAGHGDPELLTNKTLKRLRN